VADVIDEVQEQLDRDYERARKKRGPYTLPPGVPGECDGCEAESPRLIDGLCGRCRDLMRIK
jgi:hypothetical protein